MLTVDLATLGSRERDRHSGFSLRGNMVVPSVAETGRHPTAKLAPRLQYHADVDRSTDARGVHTTLTGVYRTHHPIGAPDTRPRIDDAGHEPGPAGEEHGPMQAGATPAGPEEAR